MDAGLAVDPLLARSPMCGSVCGGELNTPPVGASATDFVVLAGPLDARLSGRKRRFVEKPDNFSSPVAR